MVKEDKRKFFGCFFLLDVKVCGFRKTEKFDVLPECAKCVHYHRFFEEMDKQEDEFWREVDAVRKEQGVACVCDGKECNSEIVGSCFRKSVDDVLIWVCPRFDVNCFRDGAVIKKEFLRLRKGGLC